MKLQSVYIYYMENIFAIEIGGCLRFALHGMLGFYCRDGTLLFKNSLLELQWGTLVEILAMRCSVFFLFAFCMCVIYLLESRLCFPRTTLYIGGKRIIEKMGKVFHNRRIFGKKIYHFYYSMIQTQLKQDIFYIC